MNNQHKNKSSRYQGPYQTFSITAISLPHPPQYSISHAVPCKLNLTITKYRGIRELKQEKMNKSRLKTVQNQRQINFNNFIDELDIVQIIKLKLHKNDDKSQRERLKTDYSINRNNKTVLRNYQSQLKTYSQHKAFNFMVKHVPYREKKSKEITQEIIVDLSPKVGEKTQEKIIFRAQSATYRRNNNVRTQNNQQNMMQMAHYTSHNFKKKSFNKIQHSKQVYKHNPESIEAKSSKWVETNYRPSKNHFPFGQSEQLTGWQITVDPEVQAVDQRKQNSKSCKKSRRRQRKTLEIRKQ